MHVDEQGETSFIFPHFDTQVGDPLEVKSRKTGSLSKLACK